MGNGKKNKIGGAPKAKGRLATALTASIANATMRAKQRVAAEAKEEREKAKASGATQSQLKKQRKAERAIEKGKERAEEAGPVPEVVEGEPVQEGKGKRAREERERKRGTIPYKLGEKILLIGEGNFSFAHSLLMIEPPVITPHLLLATSFDTLAAAMEKYPDLMMHIEAIKGHGAKVVFGVDATDLKKCREVKDAGAWDRVGFNFPHVGAGISDQDRNVRANQTLILRFFRSIAPFLRTGVSATTIPVVSKKNKKAKRSRADSDDEADKWEQKAPVQEEEMDEDERNLALALAPPPPVTAGTVIITLRTATPYSLWSLPHLGTRGALIAPSILPRPHPPTPQPTYRIVRSFEFSPADYEGYEHRRTIGFKEGVSSAANDDLSLSARERGEKKRTEKEEKDADVRSMNGKEERKGSMRTYEFELVIVAKPDADDLYD